MIKAINTGLYFQFPQGENKYFFLIFTRVLCKPNTGKKIKSEQYVSQTFIKSLWNTLKYALI